MRLYRIQSTAQQVPAARVEHDFERLLLGADFDSSPVRRLVHYLGADLPLVAKPSKVSLAVGVDLVVAVAADVTRLLNGILDGLPLQLHRRRYPYGFTAREEAEEHHVDN